MIGRWHHTVVDCPDPLALAASWSEVLDPERPQQVRLDVDADPAAHPFCLVPRPGWASPVDGSAR